MHAPARAYCTTAVEASKAPVEPSHEMGVPAWATPGEEVWATGLFAGHRRWFKAEVVAVRARFPRILVKYTATEDGATTRATLPEVLTAYLHMGVLQPMDQQEGL